MVRRLGIMVSLCVLCASAAPFAVAQSGDMELPAVIRQARAPGAVYRPVPLWWWDGEKLEIERLRWQLDQLHEKGVDQVCLIYRAPLRSQPPYFTEDWWKIYRQMVDHAASLGMKVWLTDGIAWGSPFINNSVLEANPDFRGQILQQQEKTISGPRRVQHEIPQGYEVTEIIGAFAYRTTRNGINVADRHDLTSLLNGRRLEWDAPDGTWKLMIFYMKPMGFQGDQDRGFGRGYGIDFMNPEAMQKLIQLTTGEYERRVGSHLGKTIIGTFQDELVTHHQYGFPPFSTRFNDEFRKRMGYDLRPYLGALYHDGGKLTDKIRCNYFEVMVQLFEDAFYKPYFRWHKSRGMMIGHDQFGRRDLVAQTWGYGDYFRTQSWFQAPGYDDWDQAVPGRNWKDAKLASSIAQLYHRPRVWVEALHSSGWGLDLQEQVLTVNENYIYGANIYDMHGFDYSTYGSWYNWAPPSAHYRMPYWMHYRSFSDYVTRLSYLQSQGDHVADVGIFYPVHTIQANYRPGAGANDLAGVTESYFWSAGRHLLDHQIDFHFINDASIQRGNIQGGKLLVSGVSFSTLILPPISTIDRETLGKLREFVQAGGLLISFALLPNASIQDGRDDPQVKDDLAKIFGPSQAEGSGKNVQKSHPSGGLAVFVPKGVSKLHEIIRLNRTLDFETSAKSLMYQHRKTDGLDVYMLYNRSPKAVKARVKVRAFGTPYKFDSVTGQVDPIYTYLREEEFTRLDLSFEPYEAYHVFMDPSGSTTPSLAFTNIDSVDEVSIADGDLRVSGWHRSSKSVEVESASGSRRRQEVPVRNPIPLTGSWEFELKPTMDNRWGDYRRPPSRDFIGPEVRRFHYREQGREEDGLALGWHLKDYNHSDWETFTYSVGPYWWVLGPIPNQGAEAVTLRSFGPEEGPGKHRRYTILGKQYQWRPYSFSLEFGLEKDGDYWNLLGSKNQVDRTFLQFGETEHYGLVYLYTNVYSPRDTHALLLAATSGYWESHRIWVNGEVVSDIYHRDRAGRFGSLIGVDLKQGGNTLLIKTNQRHRSIRTFVYLLDQDRALNLEPREFAAGPPRLQRFADSSFVFDIHGDKQERVGWYRFQLPPGARSFKIRISGKARIFVNGTERALEPEGGEVDLGSTMMEAGIAAIRVVHEPGKYAGAAIPEPIKIQTGKGRIRLGDWSNQGLLSYSGAAIYRKSFDLPKDYSRHKLVLDLGRVDATASVRVNSREVGTRGWAPYRFDITPFVKFGRNEIEVTVASALGNHYATTPSALHVYERQTESGLFGPVRIIPYSPVEVTMSGQ